MAAGIGPTVRLWLQPPREPMQRTAMELREALVSRLAQGEKLSLTDAEEARVTRRELREQPLRPKIRHTLLSLAARVSRGNGRPRAEITN